MLAHNPDVYPGAHGLPTSDPQWRSTNPIIFYTASVVWGGIGYKAFIQEPSPYGSLTWFFLAGAILPIPFYLLYRFFPKAGFHYIHWPIILESVGATGEGTANGIFSVTVVAVTFQYFVRVFKRHWYDLYNYSLSVALDVGTLLAAVFIFLAFNLPGWSLPNYPLRPDLNVWDTPEYCYNHTVV
jgi:hypothetical protein